MTKNLIIVTLLFASSWENHAAKVDYQSHDALAFIDSPEHHGPNWVNSCSLRQGSFTLLKSSPSHFDQDSQTLKIEEGLQTTRQPTSEGGGMAFNPIDSSIQNVEIAELWGVSLKNHFDLISVSQGLLSNLADEAILDTIIEDTVNLAQQLNRAWNDLDDELTRKLYQGLGYLGVIDTFSIAEIPNNERKLADFVDKAYVSETDNYVQPSGFFGFILRLPKLFTLYNLFILMGIILVGNGLFRIVRYVVLRI